MKRKVLKVHPADDVIVALCDLQSGETVEDEGLTYTLLENIPAKHKFAGRHFGPGDTVCMYGITVGKVVQEIRRGACITTENVKHSTSAYTHSEKRSSWVPPDISDFQERTFLGYQRRDGRVGTANHWIVAPMVYCENANLDIMRETLNEQLGYADKDHYRSFAGELIAQIAGGACADEIINSDIALSEKCSAISPLFPNVDGLKFLTHTSGCGGTGYDARTLCWLLAGYINHPNVAGATILSLGCQNSEVRILEEELHRRNPHFDKPLYIFDHQKLYSETRLLSEALKATLAGLIEANKHHRIPISLDKLVLGVECGGSDGFSGISANPAIGQVSDFLVALGGSVILAEFPELAGTEQELAERCVEAKDAERFIELMQSYESAAEKQGSSFAENPSPGNIKDGLITDAIKSAGAARKGGTAPIMGVYDYPEEIQNSGLSLLCTPGGDVESTTALAGAGANLILFSTGLGTPTGNPIAPVLKVSSNTSLFERMNDIIDLNAGEIINGKETIEQCARRFLEICIQTASGEFQPRAVHLGQDDFIPWRRGPSL